MLQRGWRVSLITARPAQVPGVEIRTLREWGVRLDEALFLGGRPKGPFLEAFGADIFFDDVTVSRRHAEITRTGGFFELVDQRSLNGSYVNGERVDRAVLDDALVLTIDRTYFDLTGGLDRWLYRLVRKHGGRQEFGWSFDFPHLHSKSGSLSPLKHFAYDLRDIVKRQPLPGYRLTIEQCVGGPEILSFVPTDPDALGIPRRRRRTKSHPGDKL